MSECASKVVNQSYVISVELTLEEDSTPIGRCFAHRLAILVEHKGFSRQVERTLAVGMPVEAVVAARSKLVAATSCKRAALSDGGILTVRFRFLQRTT